MGFRVWGLGLRVYRFKGYGFRMYGAERFRIVSSADFRVYGFRSSGLVLIKPGFWA